MPRALVVLHSDGFVEVFGDQGLDVQVVLMPHMESRAGELLAEQWLEGSLPLRMRGVYCPQRRVASGKIRTLRPTDILQAEWELELLRRLDRLEESCKPTEEAGEQWWT